MPRSIGLVTSLGAAALHDVVTALRRRAPHIPVVLAPAAVQGANAPAELVRSLESLYALVPQVDVILLVRGGGSIEDLWAFNDEMLARTIARSPVPLVSGVGHETDFTIADFCADVRAPTPTAAAELVAAPRDLWLGALELIEERLRDALLGALDASSQRLDVAAGRLGRPSELVGRQRLRLAHHAQRMHFALQAKTVRLAHAQQVLQTGLPSRLRMALDRHREMLNRASLRMKLLDPELVLQRGYAIITDRQGHAVTSVEQLAAGNEVQAHLGDGRVDLKVLQTTATRMRPTAGG